MSGRSKAPVICSIKFSTCTVTLSKNAKALLTEDEIAQITAKGYTLA